MAMNTDILLAFVGFLGFMARQEPQPPPPEEPDPGDDGSDIDCRLPAYVVEEEPSSGPEDDDPR